MQYDPIKKILGRFFSGSVFMRKTFFVLLDLLLLRTWHVKKAIRKISAGMPQDASILDAGAGFGQYSWWMARKNRSWIIKAVDIDAGHVADAGRFFMRTGFSGRVACEILDLTRLKDTDAFDLILSVDVMEHIKDDELVFRNFFHALKQRGAMLISTPSDKGGSDVHDAAGHSFIDEHVRNGYGIPEITEKLVRAGFSDIKALYTYGKPGHISWLISMKYPVMMLGLSRIFFIFLPFYYLITFPFALFLNFLDVSTTHRSGTGLLVLANR
ncbi:MAG: class I SAM-dependent methyltransferase [Bacteroidota bacterium]|nr:class I SAM-dependent methyltransferase [Bacteroidota bacterium]